MHLSPELPFLAWLACFTAACGVVGLQRVTSMFTWCGVRQNAQRQALGDLTVNPGSGIHLKCVSLTLIVCKMGK